jgi:hypothetical protein
LVDTLTSDPCLREIPRLNIVALTDLRARRYTPSLFSDKRADQV